MPSGAQLKMYFIFVLDGAHDMHPNYRCIIEHTLPIHTH